MATKTKTKKHDFYYTYQSAHFSDCERYRYLLTRTWDDSKPSAMCVGLNPSTATREKNDATISWLTAILQHHGFGELLMTNLYALISSKPEKLFEVSDPQKDNDQWLIETAKRAGMIIYCWGSFPHIEFRAKQIQKMLPQGFCFGKSASSMPYHPLYHMYEGIPAEKSRIIRFNDKTK